MLKEAAQGWLERRVHSRNDVSGAVVLLDQLNQLETAADWPKGGVNDPELVAAARQAFVDRRLVSIKSARGLVVSKPLLNQGVVVGSVAMRMADLNAANDSKLVKDNLPVTELAAIEDMPKSSNDLSAKRNAKINPSSAFKAMTLSAGDSYSLVDLMNAVIEIDTLEEAATTVASDLASRLEFDRVSIGLLDGRQAKVIGVSHSADIQPLESAVESIRDLMDEAIDQATDVVFPASEEHRNQIVISHNEHSARHGSAQILSFLLVYKQSIVGALVCERKNFMPITQDQLVSLKSAAQTIGPVLELKRDLGRSMYFRLRARLLHWWGQLSSTQDRSLKIGIGLLAAVLLALPLIPMQYHLSADAKLEGEFQRALVAPTDGYLKTVHVRPGDLVKQGQLLAELSDEDFLLEKRRLESELLRHEASFGEALGKQDRAQVLSANARATEARSQLQLVEQQISRSVILAPIDGVITKGDLKQKLGAPLKRGEALFSVAPATGFRVIVAVPDRKIDQIKVGQKGRLVLTALPKSEFVFEVAQVVPIATQRDGKNIFEVEGKLVVADDAMLRPGMEGVAKIDAPPQSTYERLGSQFFDWLKIVFWSWSL
jgi:Barrel-sandwich domain of CusB or HlyD membrane-fusion/GAF domain